MDFHWKSRMSGRQTLLLAFVLVAVTRPASKVSVGSRPAVGGHSHHSMSSVCWGCTFVA